MKKRTLGMTEQDDRGIEQIVEAIKSRVPSTAHELMKYGLLKGLEVLLREPDSQLSQELRRFSTTPDRFPALLEKFLKEKSSN